MKTDNRPSLTGRVVVGSDGSPNSRRALDWAAGYARVHGIALSVVRVTPSVPLPTRTGVYRAMRQGSAGFQHSVREHAQRELDTSVADARAAHADVEIAGELLDGEVAAVLSEISGDAGVLVLGATGASAVSRVLLGGSVAAVMHHARGPVVIVPDLPARPEGRIVVGLDDAASSQPVAERALGEAAAFGAALLAVYAWEVLALFASNLVTDVEVNEVDRVFDSLLAELTGPAELSGIEVTRVVRHGRAEDVLVDLSQDASLVIVGSRGQGGFTGLLLGSVSRSVIARSACPVLLVPNAISTED